MLVKDIELIPAIVDLVDNSVDGALLLRPGGDFAGLWIRITTESNRFVIEDNCGGIPLDTARRYAFRFGRPTDFPPVEGSVGQFGVGMKRALFKLGRGFRIDSRTQTTRFVLRVDVDAWASEPGPDWSFLLDDVDESYQPAVADDVGTLVEVTPLHSSVADDLGLTQVLASLRTDLQLRHQHALESGIDITLNNEHLVARPPALLMSPAIKPIHVRRTFQANGGASVDLDLFAGLVGPPEEEEVDEGEAEQFRLPGEAGWYLFCNNRLLLVADRTALTGWGNGAAAYHPQYRRFRGYAYLWSQDSSLLPWNTTKTGVDRDSRVFRWVQGQMVTSLRGVLAVINRAKKERQEREPDDRPLVSALAAAPEVELEQLEASETMQIPPRAAGAAPDVQRIAYGIPRQEFDAAREELGADSPAEVGRQTFRYFYDREVPS
ncbi:MAG: ATP-binding protein [Chloroflexota bacterium]